MIDRHVMVLVLFLFAFVGIQAGTDYFASPDFLGLGLDSPPASEVNGLITGIDSPTFPMVAGVSTSNDLCTPSINIIIN